jgi:uncharacterized protein (DUF58 family)
MRMKVTVRGRAVLAAAVALAFSTLLYRDLLVLTALLVLVAVTVGEAIWVWVVTSRPTKWFSISNVAHVQRPFSISKSLHPGENSHDDLYFLKKIGGEVALVSRIPSLKFNPDLFKRKGVASKVDAAFKTPFAGRYSSDVFGLAVSGPLRIISATCALPAKVSYSVYPRVVGVAITSAKLLGKGGAGESSVESPGLGTEFYGMREYQTGESYRYINWKATARRGELLTNELMKDVSGAHYLVLEAVSPDNFDRDRLAATFLGMANTLTMQGVRFGVVVHDRGRIRLVKKVDVPAVSLALTLKAALEFTKISQTTFEKELPPTSSYALGPARRLLAESGPVLLRQIEDFAISEKRRSLQNQDAFQTIIELVRENTSIPSSIVYVSGLFDPVEPVIELGSLVKRTYGVNFVVVNPSKPWVAAKDEEDAYDAYARHSEKMKALRNAGIDYQFGEPGVWTESP